MRLFKERLFGQWHGIGRFIHKNMDIVSWVYVLVPGLAFTYFLLRETVFKLEYGLLAEMNVYMLIAILLFGSSLLKSRFFIEQADQVFLIQHEEFVKLKRCGYWYALIFNMLLMMLAYSLLFPLFYMVKGFSVLQMGMLALSMVCSYLLCDAFDLSQRKLLRIVMKISIVLLLTFAVIQAKWWMLSLVVVMAVLCIYFVDRYTIQRHNLFHRQLELDVGRATRFFSLIFQANKDMQITKIKYFKRNGPKWFAKLYAQNKQATLTELILKTIWRNTSYLRLLLQLVAIMIPLLIVLPIWMNVLLIIFCYFGLKTYFDSLLIEIKENPIFKLIRYPDTDWMGAIKKVRQYIVIPVIALYVLIVIVKLFVG